MQKIFISYRRADSADVTGRVCDHLKRHFGDEVLFKDVDSIPFGRQFPDVIEQAIAQCDVLLAMIGRQWLTIAGRDGKRRLDNPGDYVRREIAGAFAQGKTVVPVLVHGAPMPQADSLPEDLRLLPTTNAAPVRPDPDFDNDMARLCRQLEDEAGILTAAAQRRRYGQARRHELDGDYAGARRAYLEYFRFDLAYVDPHLRFVDFLKLQEGRAGAREIYAQVVRRSAQAAPELAAIGLLAPEQREAAYAAYVQAHPDVTAACYLWSGLYSAERLGERSLDAIRRERELLAKFLAPEAQRGLVASFLDQEWLAEWQTDAGNRLEATRTQSGRLDNPVSLTWSHSNSGWMGAVQIVEPALEIFWRAPGAEDFVSTGFSRVRSYSTGKPQPNAVLTLPDGHAPCDLEIRYTDASGHVQGPFTLRFDPAASALQDSQYVLEMLRHSWVQFGEHDGRLLLYFTTLLTHRGVLARIAYGLDTPEPDREFEFPAYDKPGNAPITSDVTVYLEVPAATRYATVQLTFTDGSVTGIVRHDR